VLRAPELDAGLQLGSHRSRVEGQNHLPQPAAHTSLDAAQDTVGLLGFERTLPGHVQLFFDKYSKVLLVRAALKPFSTQTVFVPAIGLTQVQDLALGLVEVYEVHTGPSLKPVKVALDGIPSLRRVDRTTQLGIVGKLVKDALNPTVHFTNKDVKEHQSQY